MASPPVVSRSAVAQTRARRLLSRGLLVAWPLVVSCAVIVPAVLLNKTTEFDIQLVVSRLSFRVSEPLQSGLFGSVAANSMTVVSFGALDLGPGHFEDVPPATSGAGANSVRITAADPLARTTLDDVTVQEIRVPMESTVALEWEGGALAGDGQAVSLRADALTARFSPRPGNALAIRACVGCQLDNATLSGAVFDHPARFLGATDQLMALSSSPTTSARRGLGTALRLELAAGTTLAETVIPVPGGIDTTISEGAKRVSTIMEGAITYPRYMAAPHGLKAGDVLVLGDIPDLRILSLQIDKGIRVRLHGRASHVSAGPPGFAADTVPTWFQWYMSSLFPYVHATIALAAVALAVFQKFRAASTGESRP